jgi:hypothetical protein
MRKGSLVMCDYFENPRTKAAVKKIAKILNAEDAMVSSHALVWYVRAYLLSVQEDAGSEFAYAVAAELTENIANVLPAEGRCSDGPQRLEVDARQEHSKARSASWLNGVSIG